MKTFSRILSVLMAMAVLLTAITGAMTVSAAADDLVITDCDTTDGWVVTGGTGVSINANGYGTNTALHRQVNYGACRNLTYNLPTPLDISNYTSIEWDTMFYTQKANGATGTMWEQILNKYVTVDNALYLKLISATGYRVYRLSKLDTTVNANSWVHFSADIDDFNTEVETFDETALTGFYFSTTDGAVDTTIDDGFMRFDNIKATGYAEPQKTPVVITECEDTTGWSYAGTAAITNSASGKTGSALMLEGGYGILRKLTYTASTPVDATDYKAIEWDMTALAVKVITDQFEAVAESYTDTIGVEISDGTNTATFGLLDMQISKTDASWWHFAISLENSGLNLSNIVSFAIYTKPDGAGNTELANTIYKLDNIYATDAAVVPNGYDYAAVKDIIIEDAEDLSGWTYYGETTHANMSLNTNGYTGSAVQIFGGYCKIGPVKYTFANPVNVSRHGNLSWNIRILNGTANPDMWETVAAAYAEYIKATVTDANGNSYAYGLSDIKVEATAKEGWYTMSIDFKKASAVDFSALSSFTFQVSDGAYMDTSLINGNLRIDNLTAVPAAALEMGDVTGDGNTDARDLVRFKKYKAGMEVEFFAEVADINADGEVTIEDLAALRSILLGDEVATSQYALLNNDGWSEVVKP